MALEQNSGFGLDSNSGVNSSSKLKSKFWAFLVLALVLVGAGAYVYNYMTADASTPPSLTPATNLQGMMKIESTGMTVYEGTDVDAYKAGDYGSCDTANKKTLEYGIHYFTTTEKTTFGEFFNKIQPVEGEYVLIAQWDATADSGKGKWTMYPDTDYYDKTKITFLTDANVDTTEIKAFTTVIVVYGGNKATYICDGSLIGEDGKMGMNSEEFFVNYLFKGGEVPAGWYLAPYGVEGDGKFFDILKYGLGNKVASVWLSDPGADGGWRKIPLSQLVHNRDADGKTIPPVVTMDDIVGGTVMVWVELSNDIDMVEGYKTTMVELANDSDKAKVETQMAFADKVIVKDDKVIYPDNKVKVVWNVAKPKELAVDFGDRATFINSHSDFSESSMDDLFVVEKGDNEVEISKVDFPVTGEPGSTAIFTLTVDLPLVADDVYRLFIDKKISSSKLFRSYVEFKPSGDAVGDEVTESEGGIGVGLCGADCGEGKNCVTKIIYADGSESPSDFGVACVNDTPSAISGLCAAGGAPIVGTFDNGVVTCIANEEEVVVTPKCEGDHVIGDEWTNAVGEACTCLATGGTTCGVVVGGTDFSLENISFIDSYIADATLTFNKPVGVDPSVAGQGVDDLFKVNSTDNPESFLVLKSYEVSQDKLSVILHIDQSKCIVTPGVTYNVVLSSTFVDGEGTAISSDANSGTFTVPPDFQP